MLNVMPLGLSRAALLPKGFHQELLEVQKLCQSFQNDFLNDHLKKIEGRRKLEPDFLDFDLLNEINRRGFFSLWLPKVIGGRGFHPLSMMVFNEQIGSTCLGVANIVGAHYFGFGLLALSHNYKLIRNITGEICSGEKSGRPCVLSAAVTEPTAGTDREDRALLKKATLSCSAQKVYEGYLLNGEKIYISNASWARYHIVVTTSDLKCPASEAIILVVPTRLNGVSVSPPMKKWGQAACPASKIHFGNCLVPKEFVALDHERFSSVENFHLYSSSVTDNLLAQSRAGVSSLAAGVCQKSLLIFETEMVKSSSKNEEWMQAKLSELLKNQWVSKLIAWDANLVSQTQGLQGEMLKPMAFYLQKWLPRFVWKFFGQVLEISSVARFLLQRSAKTDPRYALGTSSLAKFSATDLAHESLVITLQIFFSSEAQGLFRDAKLLQIYEGTNQLNRLQSASRLTSISDLLSFAEPVKKNPRKGSSAKQAQLELQLMRTAFNCCFSFAEMRQQGGRKLLDWSEHRELLETLRAQLEALESSLSIDLVHENCVRFISICMQLMGGFGYMLESGLPAILDQAFLCSDPLQQKMSFPEEEMEVF